MSIQMPDALENALQKLIQGVALGPLTARAQAISSAYRSGMGSKKAVPDAQDALAYALTRMPATFAAVDMVLDAATTALPDFAPQSMLDLGAGPGTAAWAASHRWPDLPKLVLADRHGPFQDLAKALVKSASLPGLAAAEFLTQDLSASTAALPQADLVVAAYLLAEFESDAIYSFIRRALQAAAGILILVEPGTPAGHQRLLQARDTIMAAGGHILAPCPNEAPCPMTGEQWCRFAVRLARSRTHRMAKGAALPFEDEPVSYLVATRLAQGNRVPARIVGPPQRSKIGIALSVCQNQSIDTITIPSRDRARSAIARKLRWGDPFHSHAT